MQAFKLTPKPQSDYRKEVKLIKGKCNLEDLGYRHNKIVYGFCEKLPDISRLQSHGMKIEEITFDETQLCIIDYLVERDRIKSKIERFQQDRKENGKKNEEDEAVVQQKMTELNSNILPTKVALGITGTLKILKF